jgi:tetratricopeptide (TPR) repeat protein
MSELPAGLSEEIKALCASGYTLYDSGDYRQALHPFHQAWLLLPKPPMDFIESGMILTAMGDCHFRNKTYEQGKEKLEFALQCSGMIDNPFIHLRLGQCLLELGIKGAACTHLSVAYQRVGRKIFEKEAPKYLIAAMQPDSV